MLAGEVTDPTLLGLAHALAALPESRRVQLAGAVALLCAGTERCGP